MLDLSDLYQFVTYADCGTLSAAAEKLHISQPTLTRTMHDVEDAFGVPLFHRGKNRIELTDYCSMKQKKQFRPYRHLNAISIRLPFIPVLPHLYGHYCLNCHADFLIILFPQN